MTSMGLDPYDDYYDSLYGAAYCRLINPGQTNNMLMQKNDGYGLHQRCHEPEGLGLPEEAEAYLCGSLNLYLEHPFDGTWYGRIDYTYTYAHGNTAGQVRPDFGQSDISKTEDWDHWELMQGQDGELLNSRKHVDPSAWCLPDHSGVAGVGYGADPVGRARGVPGLLRSGRYPVQRSDGYNRRPELPLVQRQDRSSGRKRHTPWTHQLNLGVRYTPAWADKKLAFKLDVYNVLNQQRATQTYSHFDAGDAYHPAYGTTSTYYVDNTYGMALSREAPRYVRISVSYDY